MRRKNASTHNKDKNLDDVKVAFKKIEDFDEER